MYILPSRVPQGMPRYEVRYKLIDELTRLGLFRGTTPNAMRLGLCSRSKDVVEPVIRPQWFCKCSSMAAKYAEDDGTGEYCLVVLYIFSNICLR